MLFRSSPVQFRPWAPVLGPSAHLPRRTHCCRSAPWPHVPRKTPAVILAGVSVFSLRLSPLHSGPRHRCVRDFPTVPVGGVSSREPLARQSASGRHVHGGVFQGHKKSPGRGAGAEEKEMKRLLDSDSLTMSAEGMWWLRLWPKNDEGGHPCYFDV